MKTIILTDDQFDTLFEFVHQKVESIVDTSVDYNDSEILNEWEDYLMFIQFQKQQTIGVNYDTYRL